MIYVLNRDEEKNRKHFRTTSIKIEKKEVIKTLGLPTPTIQKNHKRLHTHTKK